MNLFTGETAITLITFAVFSKLLTFVRATVTFHIVSLAFLLAMAHNVLAEDQREQSRLVFNRACRL